MGSADSVAVRLASGRWLGFYRQHRAEYPQEQTMEFADGIVRGDGRDGIGPFRIEGSYRSEAGVVRVGWIKTYDRGHSVLYLGVVEQGWIRGDWELTRGYGDAFGFRPEHLVRAGGEA